MKLYCVLLCLIVFNLTPVDPKTVRSIIDEAREQLKQLRSIVEGAILAAHGKLSTLDSDFLTHGNNVKATATLAIEQARDSYKSQLQTIKDLAHNANKDISSCTNVREEILNRLPDEHLSSMQTCIYGINQQEAKILEDGVYTVDVTINKVNGLEYQFESCNEDLLCISPLLTEINLDKVRLPQQINEEVAAVTSLVNTLKISVQSCADASETSYLGEASAIFQDIIDCANQIIGLFIIG